MINPFTDKRFRLGVILQLSGITLFALTVSTYAVFFTFYVFLLLLIIGCVVTLTSKVYRPVKILFSLWPIIALVVIIPGIFIHSWWLEYRDMQRYQPETYLIPDGYVGGIRVRFGYDHGIEMQYANNRREYIVPQSGILLTKFEEQEINSSGGYVYKKQEALREYYYVKDGARIPIPVITEQTIDSTSNEIALYVIYHGTDFIVAPQRDFPQYWIGNYEYNEYLDSLQGVEAAKLP